MTTTVAPVAGLLPDGFRVALDPALRWAGDGTVLVGGSPNRLLRLTPAGRRQVAKETRQWEQATAILARFLSSPR